MLWVGLLIGGLSIFVQAYAIQSQSTHWQTMVFSVLTLSQMAHVLAVRSETHSLFQIGVFSNLPLLGAVSLTVALQLAAIYLPAAQHVFKTAPLTASELLTVVILCSFVFVAVEFEKWLTRRFHVYG
jgi:Ca2+-transporting ATPase